MEHYYLNFKDNIIIGTSRARLINDEIECREVTKEEYDAYEEERQTQLNLVNQIEKLKQNLADYDYKGQKYLDGEYTEEEWQEIVAQRKQWRQQIRELENQINGGK